MQFFTVASALMATALAAPALNTRATTENIDITDLFVRKTGNDIVAFDFKLTGDDAKDLTCSTGAIPSLPSETTTCGDSDYRFVLTKGKETEFSLSIYHQTGVASGRYNAADIVTYCRAGGNGPDDFICGQVNQVTIVISS
jgi:hypothetical protein